MFLVQTILGILTTFKLLGIVWKICVCIATEASMMYSYHLNPEVNEDQDQNPGIEEQEAAFPLVAMNYRGLVNA